MLQATLFGAPAGRVDTRQPRPYQVQALAGIREKLGQHRSTAVILFTGGGKTFIAARAAMEASGRVLFLAHLDTLVSQSRRELEAMTGLPWDVEQGEFTARASGHHVVASVASLMRENRLRAYAPDAFSLIIVDEAHHYVADAFKRPLDYFANAKVVALTATPDRKDKKAMKRYVESVAFKMDLVDGIDGGWLTPIDCRPPIALDVALDVKTKNGDFVEADLEEKIKEVIAPICKAAIEYCEDWPTVIFTPRVESAHAAAQRLNQLRPGCARAIDGSMDRETKRGVVAAFRNREFQFLANCGVLVEGWDDRGVICMIDAAPTKSRARCVQKLGRILRPLADVDACATAEERIAAIAASKKPRAIWIDLKFQGQAHDLACPVDILGGTFTDKEKAAAKKLLDKKGGDARQALEAARKRLAQAAERAKAKMALGSYDPTKRNRKPKREAPNPQGPVTAGQLRRLAEFGIPAESVQTYEAAQKALRYEFMAKAKGWCDARQRAWLQRNCGVSGKGLTKEAGRRLAVAWKERRDRGGAA